MKLYIIRHADPDYPRGTITEQGHREAQALARRLVGERLDLIYSSPLGRARDTARYTTERTGIEPLTLDWIQEIPGAEITIEPGIRYGAWDAPGEMVYDVEWKRGPDGWVEFPHLERTGMREKVTALHAESDQFFATHGYRKEGRRYAVERPNSLRIAFFCHNGFGLTWLAYLLNLAPIAVWTGFWLPPSSVTTVAFEERSPAWAVPRCLGLGDVAHLHAEGLPISYRGVYGRPYIDDSPIVDGYATTVG